MISIRVFLGRAIINLSIVKEVKHSGPLASRRQNISIFDPVLEAAASHIGFVEGGIRAVIYGPEEGLAVLKTVSIGT